MFLTGPESLTELRAHRDQTLTLIDQAQVTGYSRVGEMNQQILTNLDRMITEHVLNPAAAPPPRSKAQRSPDGGSGLRHLAGRDAARVGRLLGPCRLRRSQCAKDTRDTTVNSRTIVLTMP